MVELSAHSSIAIATGPPPGTCNSNDKCPSHRALSPPTMPSSCSAPPRSTHRSGWSPASSLVQTTAPLSMLSSTRPANPAPRAGAPLSPYNRVILPTTSGKARIRHCIVTHRARERHAAWRYCAMSRPAKILAVDDEPDLIDLMQYHLVRA